MKKIKFTHLLKTALIVSFIGLIGQSVSGQTSLTAIGASVTENFDGLSSSGTWKDGTTWTEGTTPLPSWYALTGDVTIPTTYSSNTGSTYNTSGLYSFGTTTGATNRALGWVPSGVTSALCYYGWRLKNTSASTTMKNLQIKWRGQQWRKTTASSKNLVLSYQKGSSLTSLTSGTFTTVETFTSPFSGSGTSILDGNATGNYTDFTDYITVNLAPGEEIMLRWQDTRTGSTQQLLAIDNVSVTPVNDQTITFTDNLTIGKTYGDGPFQLNGTSTSGLALTYTSTDPKVATISGSTVTITGAGKAIITASQPGNSFYTQAINVTQEIWINPKPPKIGVPSNITSTSFDVNWSDNNGINNTKLEYKIEIDTDPSFTNSDEIYTGTAVYTANTLDDGGFTYTHDTKYYYRIYTITSDNLWSTYSQASFIITGINYQTYNLVASPTFTTSSITYSKGSFNWSNGDPAGRIVFMKEGEGAITIPSNNTTYTASTNWLSPGTQLGSSGYYCIYAGSGTSVSLTGLYPGRTYTVQAFEYQGQPGSEVYMTDVSGASNPITFIPWPSTTWTNSNGVSTAENWNNTARWDHGVIPTASLHPAVLVYIDGNCQVINTAESNNLTIKAAHGGITPKLSVNTGQALNVVGLLTNSGDASALVIRAAANVPNGTLTFGSGSPQANVEMYSKATWNLNNSVNNRFKWQFFGIPVKSLTAGSTFDFKKCFVREWDESVTSMWDVWSKRNDNSTLYKDATSILSQSKGYELVQQYVTLYTFAGELLNDNFTQTLNYTSTAAYKGQNIFGNPYTSAISIKDQFSFTNAVQAVYLYNTGTFNDWNGGTIPGSGPGQYTVSTPGTAGIVDGVPTQIPSMQSFLIQSLTGGGSFTINRTGLTKNTDKQRVKSNTASTPNISSKIDVIGTNSSDRMWLVENPICTRNFDNGYDGPKVLGTAEATQLYGLEADGNYQINVVSGINESYLGFQPGTDTQFKLVFNHQNTDSKYSSIYLTDLVANQTVNITQTGTEYPFTAASNDVIKRFKITAVTNTTTGLNSTNQPSAINIYDSHNSIFIDNKTDQSGEMSLYNALGSCIRVSPILPNELNQFNLNLNKGVYFVKATINAEKVTKSIIIN
jgi:hypothetical protein